MDALIPVGYARLNITYDGQQGELPDLVSFDAPDDDVRRWAEETIRNGGIPGITRNAEASLEGFVVERFPAREDLPNRIVIRPKTAFGTAA